MVFGTSCAPRFVLASIELRIVSGALHVARQLFVVLLCQDFPHQFKDVRAVLMPGTASFEFFLLYYGCL